MGWGGFWGREDGGGRWVAGIEIVRLGKRLDMVR